MRCLWKRDRSVCVSGKTILTLRKVFTFADQESEFSMMEILADAMVDTVELLLTVHAYNTHSLSEHELPPPIRRHFWNKKLKGIPKPLRVRMEDVCAIYGHSSEDVKRAVKSLPFVDVADFGSLSLTVLDVGLEWYKGKVDEERIVKNPAVAYCISPEKYERALKEVLPLHAERLWIDSMIEELRRELDEEAEEMLKLCTIVAPDEVMLSLGDIVLTDEQKENISKIVVALEHRDYLSEVGLYDVGKVLFVGPPGTGKTSTARALSKHLKLPLLEVKLSMVTNQYLGETSKNIDRVFELAKRLSPCILFIDEFDFVAKTRTSDEHAAIKRAVNTLLKAIDEISLVRHGVLLISATNHPQLLDVAAWRRFDDVVWFPLPNEEMRKEIWKVVCKKIDRNLDFDELASLTEGFSGSDIRTTVKEAVLSALMEGRKGLTQEDLVEAVKEFKKRLKMKKEEGL